MTNEGQGQVAGKRLTFAELTSKVGVAEILQSVPNEARAEEEANTISPNRD